MLTIFIVTKYFDSIVMVLRSYTLMGFIGYSSKPIFLILKVRRILISVLYLKNLWNLYMWDPHLISELMTSAMAAVVKGVLQA